MTNRRQIWVLFVTLIGVPAIAARGDVIVIANRTDHGMSVVLTPLAGESQQLQIPSGDAAPMFMDGRAHVEFVSRGRPKRYLLDANCAYYFGRGADGGTELQKIGLGEDESTTAGRSLSGSSGQAPPVAVIPVKILVDEEEPARQMVWERRLRSRVEAASAILERTCRVRLNVVAVGGWISDNATTDFFAALGEFERKVSPYPGKLAIGFSSQFSPVRGRIHMAGTRGPLHSHILIRDGSPQVNELERLEFLVHELGHYLGASHSPEPTSVMRPVLGDNRAGKAGFRVRFDPVNTLIMAMVGEEMRRNEMQKITDLSAGTKLRLRQIYGQLARATPDDPAGEHYEQLMAASSAMPLAAGTKQVLQAIVRAALANRALPLAGATPEASKQTRRTGDDLTQYYVRHAALAASKLPAEVGPNALLLALGIGLDDSGALLTHPDAATAGSLESQRERSIRLTLIGEPTMHGRRDLAQHFFISAYLAAASGAASAEVAGLAKEFLDLHGGGSGFSFTDLAADRAGIQFAGALVEKRVSLPMVAQSFAVPAFVPPIDGLPENLNSVAFAKQFGGKEDDRFREKLRDIDRLIQQLPPYRLRGSAR